MCRIHTVVLDFSFVAGLHTLFSDFAFVGDLYFCGILAFAWYVKQLWELSLSEKEA
jgi:hypothetical protein